MRAEVNILGRDTGVATLIDDGYGAAPNPDHFSLSVINDEITIQCFRKIGDGQPIWERKLNKRTGQVRVARQGIKKRDVNE